MIVALMVAPLLAWVRFAPADAATAPPSLLLMILAACALLTLSLSLIQIFVHIGAFGGSVIRGNRDDYPATTGFAARLGRAHANALENLTPFAAVVLSVNALGISNRWTVGAAALFLAARLVHALTYSAGLTVVRSAAFYAGIVATIIIALQLPWFSAWRW
jgi:uncharacterized MAPEG superfamily protein